MRKTRVLRIVIFIFTINMKILCCKINVLRGIGFIVIRSTCITLKFDITHDKLKIIFGGIL